MLLALSAAAALLWCGLLCLPSQPWRTRERLEAIPVPGAHDLRRVTALIPARNEAAQIETALRALAAQGSLNKIILIDDQSSDGTAECAARTALANLHILRGNTPPADWSGKLWALHQGLAHVDSDLLLLLDADIKLEPGMLAAMLDKLDAGYELVSVMAALRMESAWEKLLLPPFIYFFKLIYPFRAAADPRSRVAAAAGGCMLLEAARLRAIGGFSAHKDAIIDDCALAARVKRAGGRLWIGLTHGARAIRPCRDLSNIWNMVARTAFTQLRYSATALIACTALMGLAFLVPFLALWTFEPVTASIGAAALAALYVSFLPTVRYYRLAPPWVLTLPLAAALFLAMTWDSALRYLRGERARWKDRSYKRIELR